MQKSNIGDQLKKTCIPAAKGAPKEDEQLLKGYCILPPAAMVESGTFKDKNNFLPAEVREKTGFLIF